MGYTGVTPVTEKFLGEGDLFGIEFSEGVVFLQVESWEQVKYAPYTGIGKIDPGDSSGFQRLKDDSGDDILYIPDRQKRVIHTSIGMAPEQIRRYTNYPDGETRLRYVPNPGSPTTGDDFGYVDGQDSSYSEPTDAEELIIPPGVHLDFNFFNPDNEEREPILNMLMRVYYIRPLDPNNSQDRDAMRRIIAPGSPMPVHPAGSPRRQIRYELGENWGVSPIPRSELRRQS